MRSETTTRTRSGPAGKTQTSGLAARLNSASETGVNGSLTKPCTTGWDDAAAAPAATVQDCPGAVAGAAAAVSSPRRSMPPATRPRRDRRPPGHAPRGRTAQRTDEGDADAPRVAPDEPPAHRHRLHGLDLPPPDPDFLPPVVVHTRAEVGRRHGQTKHLGAVAVIAQINAPNPPAVASEMTRGILASGLDRRLRKASRSPQRPPGRRPPEARTAETPTGTRRAAGAGPRPDRNDNADRRDLAPHLTRCERRFVWELGDGRVHGEVKWTSIAVNSTAETRRHNLASWRAWHNSLLKGSVSRRRATRIRGPVPPPSPPPGRFHHPLVSSTPSTFDGWSSCIAWT